MVPFLALSLPLRTYANDGKHLPSSHLASVACVLLLLSLLMSKQIMPPLTHGPGCCLNEKGRERERKHFRCLVFCFSLFLSRLNFVPAVLTFMPKLIRSSLKFRLPYSSAYAIREARQRTYTDRQTHTHRQTYGSVSIGA